MKKTVLTLVLSVILFSCGQIKKHNMQKDAEEYVAIVLKAIDSKTFEKMDALNLCLDPNVNIKKKSILQKYQGDDFLEFTDILKAEIKKQTGKEAPDFVLLVLIKENL